MWQALDTSERAALVKRYCERTGFTNISANLVADGAAGDPLVAVIGEPPSPNLLRFKTLEDLCPSTIWKVQP